jgi:hypothetical protein
VPLHARPLAEWPMWLRAKLRAGRDVLGARLRVDEAALKKRELDVLPELLQMIKVAKALKPELDL